MKLKKQETTPLECLLEVHQRIIHEATPGPWEVESEVDTIWKGSSPIGGGLFSKEDTDFVLAARASWYLYWEVVSAAVGKRAQLRRVLADPTLSSEGRHCIEQLIMALTDILKPFEETNAD